MRKNWIDICLSRNINYICTPQTETVHYITIYRGVEQLVARWAHNPKVTGSSPVPATTKRDSRNWVPFLFCIIYIKMDYCLYVLFSPKHNRLYIGETADLISRFHSHNFLATKGYTVKFRPWIVVHVEFFNSRNDARVREKNLKSGQGRQWIRESIIPKYK